MGAEAAEPAKTMQRRPQPLPQRALQQLFIEARTHSHWQDRPVEPELLRQAYELARMAPTSANSQPLRMVFLRTPAAKERLRPALSSGNLDKTMTAPVTAIVAYDLAFYDRLPELFHDPEARGWFAGKPRHSETTAFRNGSLQGAYFILAARALGLDCGPMSGFDAAKVDAAFFADSTLRCNFLLNLGYGRPERLHPRDPRLAFDDACRVL